MNTTPKQQDGDGGTESAEGTRSPLEQTVLGVAPSLSGVSPAGVAAQPSPSPPPLIPSAPLPSSPPEAGSGPSIVAAPMIALAGDPAADLGAREGAAGAAQRPPDAASALERPAASTGVEATLQLARSPAPVPAVPRPARPTPPALPDPALLQQTALSADYLRAARDAALQQLSAIQPEPPPRPPVESVDTGASPLPAGAAPLPLEDTRLAGAQHDEFEELAPRSLGTRPSIAPPSLEAPAALTERPSPTGARGFEPVPVLRAPLAESLSASFGPIAELGSHRIPPTLLVRAPIPAPRPRDTGGRWMLLGSVALATVGVIALGARLWDRYRGAAADMRTVTAPASNDVAANPSAPTLAAPGSASRALLANRPASDLARADGRARVVSATGAAGLVSAGSGAAPGASPESQLAAAAGRHVLSGNYAEALPLYRQLERSWPEHTAYAAMARWLEKQVGSQHDTRTITPSP